MSQQAWPLGPIRVNVRHVPTPGRPPIMVNLVTTSGGYLTDDLLRQVAHVYAEALAVGRYPVVAVAEHFDWHMTLAGKRVQAARRRGLLPPTTPGVPRA